MKTTRLLAPLALVAALTLSACTSDDPAEFDTSGGGPTQAADDGPGTGSPVEDLDPSDLVAGPYDAANVPDGAPAGSTVTIGVHSLVVEGDTMLLELYYTANVETDDPEQDFSLFSMNGGSTSVSPLLIDRPNLTQYEVIGRTATRGWSVDNVTARALPGQTLMWWGYFAAPPEGVDTLTLQVAPGHPVIDVPVQR